MSERNVSDGMDDFLLCAGIALIVLVMMLPAIIYLVVTS